MNDEVENYKNDEFVSILGAFPDRTKILINGSADFEIRHSWNNGEPYINVVNKKDRMRCNSKRSKLKYRFNYLCLYFNT